MTLRIHFGIDPGLSGAIAVLADGEAIDVLDMPTREVGKGREVDAAALAALIREVRGAHHGASFAATLETVFAMGAGREGAGGAAAMQRLGDARGAARGVLEALGVPYIRAAPATWKREYGLIGLPKGDSKEASRQTALRIFPGMAERLRRKKDDGRAEALLLARYGWRQTGGEP